MAESLDIYADNIAPGISVFATPRKEATKEVFVKEVVTPKYVVPESGEAE
jgi:hypothetical protein